MTQVSLEFLHIYGTVESKYIITMEIVEKNKNVADEYGVIL